MDSLRGTRRRIEAIDLARGIALVAMAIYHFAWDLEFFGYLDLGTTSHGGWKLFARAIASSFLFLVGVSLVLAHRGGIRPHPYLIRLAMVAAAALAISLVTWFAVPGGFIFFGILHQIALASVIGLAFLRLPWSVTLVAAALVIAAPHYLRSAAFDHPAWWWLGLSVSNPRSNDYVPLFPWFGAVLAGIAATNFACGAGILDRLGALRPGMWARPLRFAGRHSLAVYLVHQPVLIACVWLFSQLVPPQTATPEARFMGACNNSCGEIRTAEFCSMYCACVLDRLDADGLLDEAFAGSQDAGVTSRLNEIAGMCTIDADMTTAPEEGSEGGENGEGEPGR